MGYLPIANIRPDISNVEDQMFQAVVALLWPFSSSTHRCALLLCEPDFRLRCKKGQVRVRFTGPSAKAVLKAGITIGDEILIALRGAKFVRGTLDMEIPGDCIEWELDYSQTIILHVRNLHPILCSSFLW